jgi:hypothetical protein
MSNCSKYSKSPLVYVKALLTISRFCPWLRRRPGWTMNTAEAEASWSRREHPWPLASRRRDRGGTSRAMHPRAGEPGKPHLDGREFQCGVRRPRGRSHGRRPLAVRGDLLRTISGAFRHQSLNRFLSAQRAITASPSLSQRRFVQAAAGLLRAQSGQSKPAPGPLGGLPGPRHGPGRPPAHARPATGAFPGGDAPWLGKARDG